MSKFKVIQLPVGGFDHNFSYIIYAVSNGDTAIVDPCGDVDMIKNALREFPRFQPRYILITHGHQDHVSGLSAVKKWFEAPVMAHSRSGCGVKTPLSDRQQLQFGNGFIEAIFTPGHSPDSITFRLSDDSAIFTGDTLFIDWIGYCDAPTMFNTLQNIICPLPGSNIVYSGHDYGHEPFASLETEKTRNPYLAAKDFVVFKEALKNL